MTLKCMKYFISLLSILNFDLILSLHIKNWFIQFKPIIKTTGVCVSIYFSYFNPTTSLAGDSWTDKNRLIAETWRTVDELYYDRTFNGVDWFKLRQETIKKDYKTDNDVYIALKAMLSKLNDKYTRYLTPDQYSVLMNSAIGELTGVGIELLGLDDGRVIISNLQLDSPAETSGLKKGDEIMISEGLEITPNISPEEVAATLR